MAIRRYTVDSTKSSNAEEIGFELVGKNLKGEEVGPHQFICIPKMQGASLAKVMASADKKSVSVIDDAVEFIRGVLSEGDVTRFNDLLTSKDFIIEAQLLAEIFQGLLEDYSDRPTQPSAS